ncbi:hypothetical protein Desor_5106 [Desulfosporosinus orientis DSM 765]|uniref:Uncharacterized protein n=1 Tax=Desulfosporosinus orientis (strain ATCC 19365 / DSM 765 / NCIMB 8382 / VKM B-1628 / Singapore I) TaxID=768706 RepID=G7WJR0_DESOD|nr:hypothetical protein Desor_5106 [Desulfosporosinus orientis DSM 765]
MREYIKPSINCVELRSEESLASLASTSVLWKRYALSEQVNDKNSVLFWIKFLRK